MENIPIAQISQKKFTGYLANSHFFLSKLISFQSVFTITLSTFRISWFLSDYLTHLNMSLGKHAHLASGNIFIG